MCNTCMRPSRRGSSWSVTATARKHGKCIFGHKVGPNELRELGGEGLSEQRWETNQRAQMTWISNANVSRCYTWEQQLLSRPTEWISHVVSISEKTWMYFTACPGKVDPTCCPAVKSAYITSVWWVRLGVHLRVFFDDKHRPLTCTQDVWCHPVLSATLLSESLHWQAHPHLHTELQHNLFNLLPSGRCCSAPYSRATSRHWWGAFLFISPAMQC